MDKKMAFDIAHARKKMLEDPIVGERYVRTMIEAQKNIAKLAKEEFAKSLVTAQQDRVIDDKERASLRARIVDHGRASFMIEEYKKLLQASSGEVGNAVAMHGKNQDAIGVWSFDAIRRGFNSSVAERTAKASERSAFILSSADKKLKDIDSKMNNMGLVYGG